MKIVNGKQDGMATLMKDGVPRLKFEYRVRVLSDNSSRMDQDGNVISSDPLSDMNRYSDVIDAQSIIE